MALVDQYNLVEEQLCAGEIGSPGQAGHQASSLQPIPDSWPGSPATYTPIIHTNNLNHPCVMTSVGLDIIKYLQPESGPQEAPKLLV